MYYFLIRKCYYFCLLFLVTLALNSMDPNNTQFNTRINAEKKYIVHCNDDNDNCRNILTFYPETNVSNYLNKEIHNANVLMQIIT